MEHRSAVFNKNEWFYFQSDLSSIFWGSFLLASYSQSLSERISSLKNKLFFLGTGY